MEHVSLLKAKQDLSDDEEKDMLDYLYTTQYQMRGILAISLGEFYSKYLVDFGGFSFFVRFALLRGLICSQSLI